MGPPTDQSDCSICYNYILNVVPQGLPVGVSPIQRHGKAYSARQPSDPRKLIDINVEEIKV